MNLISFSKQFMNFANKKIAVIFKMVKRSEAFADVDMDLLPESLFSLHSPVNYTPTIPFVFSYFF